MRQKNSNNSTGFQGVTWREDKKKYHAKIGFNKHRYHLGYFNSPEQAALVYDQWAKKLHKSDAYLNFPRKALK